MIIEIMAALALFTVVHTIGFFSFGAVGAALGAVFAAGDEVPEAAKKGTWAGVAVFWVVLLVVALVVAL